MDSRGNFTGRAEEYTKSRPAYADEFIDCLYERYGFSENTVIADIGAGTGKFAKQLLEKGSSVICVEPNDDMRKTAEKELSEYTKCRFTDGCDSDTKIGDKSADFVTTAQAFHWFNADMFKTECRRILKDGGKAVLVWNVRDMDDEFNRKSGEVFKKYCPKFEGFSAGIKLHDEKIVGFFDGKYDFVEFENPILFTKERFISRSLSSSYSLKEGDEAFSEYIRELESLFDSYCKDGVLAMKNKTVAYIGRV